MKSLLYLNDILTNTESVSLFSQANLENSLKREYADIISRHIRYRYGRGAAAYFIFKVFQCADLQHLRRIGKSGSAYGRRG